MGNFYGFLLIYVFGGLTFLPLVFASVLLHAHFTFPHHSSNDSSSSDSYDLFCNTDDDGKNIKSGADTLPTKFRQRHESDVAEGYFAVCREYVPGGINGKPPERTTPAGDVVAEESPSVYQSMYRSLFDRKQVPTLEANKGNARSTKRARNVFYVVLRHGHLMLYDDSEQVEVRHVISLAHHDVSIYGGGNKIPEGELWIKRNAICLTRKEKVTDTISTTKPFYLFSENCSAKEDFYFAIQHNQGGGDESERPPAVQQFEVKDMISLVQRLHSSEEHLQTRWINAIIGRLFLAVYKTQQAEDFVRLKITKKIARVKKPAFLSGIILQKIDLGESGPYITNPRLRDLTVDGDCCIEADFKYDGNFRLEIAATARIDLGTRFKAREVHLVLAVVIKKLEGHALIRFKPPPSNRFWISFMTMPHMEMNIEPIVSSRQITYTFILRAIESRIREVIAETIVSPHWDDIPFVDTSDQKIRGGIWVDTQEKTQSTTHENSVPDEEPEDEIETALTHSSGSPGLKPSKDEKSMSMPMLVDPSPSPEMVSREGHKPIHSLVSNADARTLFGLQKRPDLPKAIRSQSFASAANPVVSTDNINVDAGKIDGKIKQPKDAANSMIEISNRSQNTSPMETPVGSFGSRPSSFLNLAKGGSFSSTSSQTSNIQGQSASQATITDSSEQFFPSSPTSTSFESRSSNIDPEAPHPTTPTTLQAITRALNPSDKRQSFPAIGAAAAAAAKKWTWNSLGRNGQQGKNNGSQERAGTPDHPIGRGRPLPPPGQPLPRPEKRGSTLISIPKRKPLPPPDLSDQRQNETKFRAETVPTLPRRPKKELPSCKETGDGGLLVVEASPESEPSSPVDDGYGEFVDNVIPDDDDENESTKAPALHARQLHRGQLRDSPRSSPSQCYGHHEKDDDHLSSWQAAQEEAARSKSLWIGDQESS